MEGGNNLEQATALVAAANKVVQDPNSVGSALRTISLRLRGTSVEILEEMGEETEGVVESTSKLQEKLKALTGVDILTNTGAYKDTYTILKEIGTVWQDIDPMDQAAALELMAGKNRANTLAAILNNMQDLEGAYQSALTANGSALRENESHLNSIEGRIQLFNNAVQTMWMNFMDDDVVKWIVDLGTAIIKLIDTLGLIPTAAAGLTAIKAFSVDAKDALSILGQGLSSLITNLGKGGLKDFGTSISLTAGSILGSLGKGLLAGGITYAVTAGLGALITTIDAWAHKTEKAIERADEALNKYSEKQEDLKEQKTTVDELSAAYIRLSSGVNTLTNDNIGLTVESYEEYLDVCNQIADLYPELVAGYDAQGNAILTLQGKVDGLTESYRQAQEAAASELLSKKNKKDVWTKYQDKVSYLQMYQKEDESWAGVHATDLQDMLQGILAMDGKAFAEFYENFNTTGRWVPLKEQLEEMGTFVEDNWMYSVFNNQFNDADTSSIDAFKAYFVNELSSINQIISDGMYGVRQQLTASLIFDPVYNQLDEESKKLVNMLINNLDPDYISKLGASGMDDLIQKFSGDAILGVKDNANLINDLSDVSNDISKAIANQDSEAFGEAKSELSDLISGWARDEAGNIVIDEDADLVTKYLQNLAKNLENQSKNYEVKLQMQTDFDSETNIATLLEDETKAVQNYWNRIVKRGLDIDGSASMGDVYEKISGGLAADGKALRRDQVRSMYDEFLSGDTSEWTTEQFNGIRALDGIMQLYGTDIDTVIAKMIELGYVSESLDNIAPFNLASEKTNEAIDAFQDAISSLKDAWNSLNSEEMTKSEFIDLAQEFPELMKGVDLSDDNWMVKAKENIEALNAVKVDDFVKSLEEMKQAMIDSGAAQSDIDMVDSFINYAKESRAINEVTNAQAEYYKLVRSYGDEVRGPSITNVNEETTASIRKQIEAVKESINQYERLEDALLGTANAFDQFAKAQEVDSKNTYGEQYVTMAQTMYDALYKTGEVGSEAFWAAVRAYVPDDEYAHLLPGKEQLNAIRDYLNENVFSSLTFSDGAFEIDYSSIKKFVEKAQSAGVFTGIDASAFGLSADFINSLQKDENALEKFADQMGMTTTQVYAMLAAMDQYNSNGLGLSMLLQLDTSTAGQITLVTNQLDQLYAQREALLKQGADDIALGYNTDEIAATEAQLGALQQQAVESVKTYAMVENALKATGEKVKTVLPESIYTEIGLTGEENVKDVLQTIEKYLLNMSEPAVVELEIARQEIKDLESLDPKITAHVDIDEDSGLYEIVDGEDYHGEIDLQHYVDLKNAESLIDKSLSENLTKSETYLSEIAENTGIMAGKEDAENAPKESKNNDTSANKQPEHGGAGGTFGKPTIDTEATKLQLDTMKDFYNLGEAIAKERAMLSSKGPMDFLQLSKDLNLAQIQDEVIDIYDKLHEGAMSAEEAMPKFGELLSQAIDLGVEQPGKPSIPEIPSWLDVTSPEGKRFADAILGNENRGADSMIPQYGEAYTDPATIAPEQVIVTDSNLQIDGADNKIEGPVVNNDIQQWDQNINNLKKRDSSDLLSTEEVQDMGLEEIADKAITAGDALEYFTNKKQEAMAGTTGGLFNVSATTNGAKAYAVLRDQIASYNETLSQSDEFVMDSMEVTQEYREAILNLANTETERAEIEGLFSEEGSKIFVKDAKAIKKLVAEKKKELKTDLRLSKAQARLEYYDLYDQMSKLTTGTKVMDAATLDQINSLYDQMSAVEQTIAEYSLLETKLLDVVKAYDRFAEAQGVDSETDYIGTTEDMMLALGQAFNTGELGTETAKAAIDNLVPESVYEGLDTAEEKMKAIYDYFKKGKLSEYFTMEFDDDGGISSAEMKLENLKNFIEDGLGSVFEGSDWKHFNFSEEFLAGLEGMDNAEDRLKAFADEMGVTEEIAFAFLETIKDHDVEWLDGDYSSVFDQLFPSTLEDDIYANTVALAELEKQMANGEISAEEYATKLAELQAAARENAQATIDNATGWVEATAEIDEARGEVERLSKELIDLKNRGATETEIKMKTEQLEAASTKLSEALAKKYNLEEPTEMSIKIALETIDQQMAEWKAANTELVVDVVPKLQQDEDGTWTIPADVEATLDETEKAAIQSYLDLLNDQCTITVLADENPTDATAELDKVTTAAEAADAAIKNISDPDVDTSSAVTAINSLRTAIAKIKDKSVSITTTETTVKQTVYKLPKIGRVDGTANVQGSAHASGDWGLPRAEHDSIVGELGRETVVDPKTGRYYTVGDNGAELVDLPKGAIIFNHKQTEDLFKHGHISSRGKMHMDGTAFAEGNAHVTIFTDGASKSEWKTSSSKKSTSKSKASSAADEVLEIFDWIEVRLEEINEALSHMESSLENTIGSPKQNAIIDDMIKTNKDLYNNLIAGANEYYAYSKKLLAKIPAEHRDAAQNGAIAIESFAGKTSEKTFKAIQEYRDWVQKGADATQQAEEVLTEISALAKQAIENISNDYSNKKSLNDIKIEQLEAYNALIETDIGYESEQIYQAMIQETNKNIAIMQEQRDKMQAELNKQVEAGNIKIGSQDWYDAINDIAAIDTEIIELKTDTEDWQDAINELHFDKFDDLMSRLEAVSNEADNLIDILGNKDAVDEVGNWTDEGITQLGLYAQQMEVAEMQAKEYQEQIKYLNEHWQELGYTEQEYIEKLEELKSGQYDAINSYHDAKDAIVDLNSERVEAIKDGIQKEIDAYTELIEAKKEELDAEKRLYDFQKSVMEQQKDISDIQRQLAALSNDNSASARAKRAKLEAELAEAQAALEDTYYNQSIENQQEAYDKELEGFQNAKEEEMEGWDEYLENTEQVVADSLSTIQSNTDTVYNTLTQMGQEYGLSITDALTSPWQAGESAIQSYSDKFGLAMSQTVAELQQLESDFNQTVTDVESAGSNAVGNVNTNVENYTGADYTPPQTEPEQDNNNNNESEENTQKAPPSPGDKVTVKKSATHWGARSSNKKMASWVPGYTFVVGQVYDDGQVSIGKKKNGKFAYTGTINLKDLEGYAKGTTGVDRDQLAWIDELGDELVMHADGNGRLAFLSKGTSVLNKTLTDRIMNLAMDPQNMLDQNRPSIGMHPEIHNTEVNITMDIAEVVHIDKVTNDTIPDLTKAIEKQMDSYMTRVNNSLKKFVR